MKIRVITKKPGMVNEPKIELIESGVEALQRLVHPEGKPGHSFECPFIPELAPHGIDLWVNEEGKFNGCRANFQIYDGQDTVMGPVVFTSHDDEGATVGLTEQQIEVVLKFLAQVPQAIF